jgi:hypothetical protein
VDGSGLPLAERARPGIHVLRRGARIPPRSRLHEAEIFELRLPAQANVTLIVRDRKGIRPLAHHYVANR